jgi:hypothetical protein
MCNSFMATIVSANLIIELNTISTFFTTCSIHMHHFEENPSFRNFNWPCHKLSQSHNHWNINVGSKLHHRGNGDHHQLAIPTDHDNQGKTKSRCPLAEHTSIRTTMTCHPHLSSTSPPHYRHLMYWATPYTHTLVGLWPPHATTHHLTDKFKIVKGQGRLREDREHTSMIRDHKIGPKHHVWGCTPH